MAVHKEKIDVAGLKLENPLMVGAGPVKFPEHVREIAQSAASAIILGSITIEERAGNSGTTYYTDSNKQHTLNSKSLPNPGLKYYQQFLPEMIQIAHDHGKPLLVSAAGFSPEEYTQLAEAIAQSGADGLELNLGCPNVTDNNGKQKPIASFRQDLVGETLYKVQRKIGADFWTTVKLSPFSDPTLLEIIANVIAQSPLANAVTSTNTFPNALAFNEQGDKAITPNNGLGGLAGAALKEIGLGQVAQLRMFLPTTIAIIGVGGVSSNTDMRDYLRAGANAVQITSAYINSGPSIFEEILSGSL
jgi:dihydroorotate dehydrogenase (fumarate)